MVTSTIQSVKEITPTLRIFLISGNISLNTPITSVYKGQEFFWRCFVRHMHIFIQGENCNYFNTSIVMNKITSYACTALSMMIPSTYWIPPLIDSNSRNLWKIPTIDELCYAWTKRMAGWHLLLKKHVNLKQTPLTWSRNALTNLSLITMDKDGKHWCFKLYCLQIYCY